MPTDSSTKFATRDVWVASKMYADILSTYAYSPTAHHLRVNKLCNSCVHNAQARRDTDEINKTFVSTDLGNQTFQMKSRVDEHTVSTDFSLATPYLLWP